jgi:peptide/nickel transport system ATP-binding protein
MRLLRPPGHVVGGRVLLEGRDLRSMPEEELRAIRLKEIALVPQAAMNSLNPVMRVDAQIADGILAHEPGLRRQALRARVVDTLARVGLSPAMGDRYPDQLSGGQRQRAAMAIAVALNPKVIVADEPTSALDVVVQRQVMATLGRIQEGLQAAVILIGHDLGLIAQFADTIGVLYAGRLAEYGPIDQILERPRHPYTRLLLDSLPTLEGKRALVGIPGLPPALLNLPPGCPFAPRCPLAFDRCRDETPELQHVAPDWRVSCHLYPEHAELPPFPEGVPTDDGAIVAASGTGGPTAEADAGRAGGTP